MSYTIGTDLVPAMTAATTSGVTVSASGNISSFFGWNAFDNSTSTFWNKGLAGDDWVKVDFGSAKIVAAYTLTARNGYVNEAPKTWTVEGSNDNTNWDVLDTQTNVAAWAASEKRQYNLSAGVIDAYQYYRFLETANQGNATNLSVAEIELLEGIPDGGDPSGIILAIFI